MFRYIMFVILVVASNSNYAKCVENYAPNGNYLGCTVEKGDKILNSKWLSPVLNIYFTDANTYQGVSYFQIDGEGNYTGKTIIRRPNEDCVRYNPVGWTGKVYKIEDGTYAAWNTGAYDAFYLINLSKDGLVGNSFLIGGKDIANISERNEFFKKSKNFDFNNILKVYENFMCNK